MSWARRVPSLTLLVTAGLYLGMLWPQLGRPLVYDDVNFAFAAKAVAETGLAFANAGHMSDRWDFSQREQWALWHPPLYIYVLGAWFKLFGVGEVSGRLLGAAFGLGTAALVYLTGRRLGPAESWRREATGLLAAALYLLSPLGVQSALILDIDATVLTLLLVAMVYVLVRFPTCRYPQALWGLGGLFGVALWAKMTTPIGLLGALVVYRGLRGQVGLAWRELLAMGLGGGVLFLASWAVACAVLGMPFEMPFEVTWISFLLASESTAGWWRSPATIARAVAPGLLWAGPYLSVLFGLAAAARLARFVKTRRAEPVDLIVGFGVLVYVVYLIKLAGGFPKYHVAMLPFWALAGAWVAVGRDGGTGGRRDGGTERPRDGGTEGPEVEAARFPFRPLVGPAVRRWPRSSVVGAGVLAAVFGGFLVYFVGVGDSWVGAPSRELIYRLGVVPAVMAGVGVAGLRLLGGLGWRGAVLGVLAGMALAWSVGVERTMAAADYSTTYWYGTYGQREAAAVLDGVAGPEEFYVASKDAAWYAANQRYIDQDTLDHVVATAEGRFEGELVGYPVRVLALWQRAEHLKQHYRQLLSAGYELVAERGDYAIWVRQAR